ncbi:TlpA family protein disulfide reductase [Streptosporangium sp. NPDC087985]|uniref:TlpA family protein disulfide reductase n=1 Tax=Streptosporangium sp. NPDC087985 TaxID=3366196 RepID=UPI003814E399
MSVSPAKWWCHEVHLLPRSPHRPGRDRLLRRSGRGRQARPACPGSAPRARARGRHLRAPPTTAPSAPTFSLTLLDGSVLDVAAEWGRRPVVLVFLESWCKLCVDRQAEINKLAEEYRDVVLFVGVGGSSSVEEMKAYALKNAVNHPVGLDPTGLVWQKYHVDEPPLVALVSKGGKLLRGWPGGTDTLREQIRELMVE